MPQRPLSVILLCVGTMAGVTSLYAISLFVLAVWTKDAALQTKAIEQFKDFGIFAGGALTGFLARTSTHDTPAKPIETVVVNKPSDPVPTDPQP